MNKTTNEWERIAHAFAEITGRTEVFDKLPPDAQQECQQLWFDIEVAAGLDPSTVAKYQVRR